MIKRYRSLTYSLANGEKMTGRKWDWGFPDGHPNVGKPTKFSTQTGDGYEIELVLQENIDGAIVCSGISIQFQDSLKSAPKNPINSRYFQLLGLGEVLASAREAYAGWSEILNEVYTEMDVEKELDDWTTLGSQGFPDSKYAAVAYMYVKFVRQGLENPITALAESLGCDKNTASGRVVEARSRGLLTKPKVGNFGGRLTVKSEKLLGIKEKKNVKSK